MGDPIPKLNIIVAPDSFKGSLSSVEAALAIERGIHKALPEAYVYKVPMADGGEGTVEAMLCAVGGELRHGTVIGPLGEELRASYGIADDGQTAFIEMAAASGLPLVPDELRNPLVTTTYGTGQLIRFALDAGCRKIIIGIGGSATNDGGMGLAQALGVRFLNVQGIELDRGGQYLEQLDRIDLEQLDPRLANTEVIVMCDVSNPLCGEEGAAAIYGPQKGATPEMIERLDRGLAHYAAVIKAQLGIDVLNLRGAGAAGGLGAGLVALLGASLRPGMQTILQATSLEGHMESANLLITGEGRTDEQTAFGKVPVGLAEIALPHNVPVVCLSGALAGSPDELYRKGITALFSILNAPMQLPEAMERTAELLTQAAENAVRLFIANR